jgi:hypothetical protein
MRDWIGWILVFAAVLLGWFVYSLVWGKPWSVKLLFARTFLRLAFSGPELLTYVGILERFGIHFHNGRLSDASVAHETKTINLMKRDLSILRSYNRERMKREHAYPGTSWSGSWMTRRVRSVFASTPTP